MAAVTQKSLCGPLQKHGKSLAYIPMIQTSSLTVTLSLVKSHQLQPIYHPHTLLMTLNSLFNNFLHDTTCETCQ